jgi:hypothetical protein
MESTGEGQADGYLIACWRRKSLIDHSLGS